MAESSGGGPADIRLCSKCCRAPATSGGICVRCEREQRAHSAARQSQARGPGGAGESAATTQTKSADLKAGGEGGRVRAMVKEIDSAEAVSYRIQYWVKSCVPGKHAYSKTSRLGVE